MRDNEKYDYEGEAYQTEARIIAEYILAGDEALGRALREALKKEIHTSIREVWKEPATISAFGEDLRQYLVEGARTLTNEAERLHLHRQVKDALGAKWHKQLKEAVQEAVREFLQQGLQHGDFHPKNQVPVTGALAKKKMSSILEVAVAEVIEAELKSSLKKTILEAVKTHLTPQQVRRIVGETVKGRIREETRPEFNLKLYWKPALILLSPVLLIGLFFVLTNLGLSRSVADLEAQFRAAQSPVKTDPARQTQNSATPKSARNDKTEPSVQALSGTHPFQAAFIDSLKIKNTADPEGFAFISNHKSLVFELMYGFQEAKTLRDGIAGLKGQKDKHEQRRAHFLNSPFLELRNERLLAACMTQKLIHAVARQYADEKWAWLKDKPDIKAYLDAFPTDGDFGPGSVNLTKDVLTFLGEDPTHFTLDRTQTKTTEFLLISFLALEKLANP